MSRLKEYEEQEKARQEVAAKTRAFYKSVNIPGERTKGQDLDKARAMIEEMKKSRARPNHDKAD